MKPFHAILACVFALACPFIPTFAAAQDVPPTVKVGANFVWHLVHCKTVDDVGLFKDANLDLDDEAQEALKNIVTNLKDLRYPLTPKVNIWTNRVVDPDTNDQYDYYSVSGRSGRSKFFVVRLSVGEIPPGRSTNIYITSVAELSDTKFLEEVIERAPITLPQRNR